ncbi:MAG: type II secretion system F family protein [Candidatus Omnitrophota bacterium]
MPLFSYAIRDQKGKLISGTSEVRSKEELVRALQVKGFIVVSVEERQQVAAGPVKQRQKLHRKAKIEDLVIFARQISVLLESGVSILKAINVVKQQATSLTLLNVCRKIEEDLKTGISLRDAIAHHPAVFTQIWVDLIETGEATGQLSTVLQKLSDYFEEIASLRKKIVSALVYPMVLFCVAVAAVLIFMYKVIPVFAGIYKGFGKLPALTEGVITVSDFLQRNVILIVITVTVSSVGFIRFIKTEGGRRWFDGFKLKIPVAGSLLLSIAIERFTTALGMMLKGGISIVHALEIAIKSTDNVVLEEALERVKVSVIQGRSLSVPLIETGVFPPMVTQMIAVGEESGKLAQLLDEVSKFYADDISTKVMRFVSLFEPLLLVVMGGLIGILVVAMYLPIFSIASTSGMK